MNFSIRHKSIELVCKDSFDNEHTNQISHMKKKLYSELWTISIEGKSTKWRKVNQSKKISIFVNVALLYSNNKESYIHFKKAAHCFFFFLA